MKIFKYTDEVEREQIKLEQTTAGLRCRENIINPDGTMELHFQEPEEIAVESIADAWLELQASDAGLARGLEDLIDILEADNMNIRARLPQELKDKLARRAELRGLIAD